jgi:hypothetical protein
MTEAQLQQFPAFQSLPVYDECDERANTITSAPLSGKYSCVCECVNLQDVERCLANPRLVPLGALRSGSDGNQVVAYFGERK